MNSLTTLFTLWIVARRVTSSVSNMLLAKDVKNTPNLKGLRQEYTEINNNIRHYSALRFAVLTVHFAAFGGIASTAFNFFGAQTGDTESLKLGARIAGILVTELFNHYASLIEEALKINRERGMVLERLLGYEQITIRSQKGIVASKPMRQTFYRVLLLFWLIMIILSVTVIFRA